MNFAIRLLAAALAVLPVAALADGAPAPLTPETMWQLKRVGRAGDFAGRQVRGL